MCLGIPGRVEAVDGNVATVDYDGVKAQVRLDTLEEPVAVGDYLLVHTGFAIERMTPEDAEETLRLFDEITGLNPEVNQGE
ncbi:MAG TPA: HypC/HybG/HupF family hydrogenase formation chaperone [Candidatus Acetothermia bacterium]|jgi:hydrogenase expression/formation protein HypC|nr:HypC/HybG/HupF family hydrogenase formation chaperone [Candidatus Bipolaricaulota bacterium]HDJ29559.1 HypC/HybG/HupF family hydrogenase formation chaperone [Candidatus Acetothermia bacterium]